MARKLGPLNEEVVYLGGCSTALFMTDSLLLDVRPTKDVDCIVDIVSRSEYYKFSKKLEKQGFKQLLNESVICHHTYAWNDRKKQFTPRQIAIAVEVLLKKGWVKKAEVRV